MPLTSLLPALWHARKALRALRILAPCGDNQLLFVGSSDAALSLFFLSAALHVVATPLLDALLIISSAPLLVSAALLLALALQLPVTILMQTCPR